MVFDEKPRRRTGKIVHKASEVTYFTASERVDRLVGITDRQHRRGLTESNDQGALRRADILVFINGHKAKRSTGAALVQCDKCPQQQIIEIDESVLGQKLFIATENLDLFGGQKQLAGL